MVALSASLSLSLAPPPLTSTMSRGVSSPAVGHTAVLVRALPVASTK